jgi:hypothetical protein
MIPAHIDAIPTRDVVLKAHFALSPVRIVLSAVISSSVHEFRSLPLASFLPTRKTRSALLYQQRRARSKVLFSRAVSTCALFAEETDSVHFHLFPGTDWLLSSYSRAHPEDAVVSGPRLLDWARSTFREPVTDDYQQTTDAIFHALHQII